MQMMTMASSKVIGKRSPSLSKSRYTGCTARIQYKIIPIAQNSQSKAPVLVLPGFLYSSGPYKPLVSLLNQRGYAAQIVPITTQDWLPVLFRGASFEFYLEKLQSALLALFNQHQQPVTLVGHSAGGWIARLFLGGDVPYQGKLYNNMYNNKHLVHSLITLGTPHGSIENYPFGRVPETLLLPTTSSNATAYPTTTEGIATSSLQFTNHFYPTAQSLSGVNVVCIAGNAVTGLDFSSAFGFHGKNTNQKKKLGLLDAWDAYLAFESYKSGCGRGDVAGDGVTPICISHLPGATNLVLKGSVWHSPRKNGLWYGDVSVVDQWEQYLLMPDSCKDGSSDVERLTER